MPAVPAVAIVGRPNVGKSRLVNRIATTREAIVHFESGVTRDRNYIAADWNGKDFTLIDTGGIQTEAGSIAESVTEQAEIAISEADIIVMLVDGQTGALPDDYEIAGKIRKSSKPVLLSVNKIDDPKKHKEAAAEFYNLGLGEPVPISAEHGIGIGDLLDKITESIPGPLEEAAVEEEEKAAVAIVGRPNVGKSSLFNWFLGEKRVIVSEVPGTTRDSVDTLIKKDGALYRFIDTAGIKRAAKLNYSVDYYSHVRALKTIDRADIAVLMVDAAEGFTDIDQKIAYMAYERGCAVICLINKMDLVAKDEEALMRLNDSYGWRMRHLWYVPVVEISVAKGRNLKKILPLIDEVILEFKKRVETTAVNRFLEELRVAGKLEQVAGRRLKIYYASQVQSGPPVFRFSVNNSNNVSPNFRSYMEKQIRKKFGFKGCTIFLSFKGRRGK